MLQLCKKKDPADENKYRGVTLLCMLARIHMHTTAKRLLKWAEARRLLHKNQFGFRKNMSTEDMIMIIRRIHEEVRELEPALLEDIIKMLDLLESCPRLLKDALLEFLGKIGMGPAMLRNLQGSHEMTQHILGVGRDRATPHHPDTGVPEGGADSPVLFNLLRNEAMRQAREDRGERTRAQGHEVGIPWTVKPVPRLSAGEEEKQRAHRSYEKRWTDPNFADDTNPMGRGEQP